MIQQVKSLVHKYGDPSSSPRTQLKWKERRDSTELSPDLHVHTVVCFHTVIMNKIKLIFK